METVQPNDVKVTKPTKKAVKKPSKKKTVKKSVKKTVTKKTVKKDGKSKSKMEMARQIMEDHKGEKRADVLLLFVSRCGLTEKGAATYYQLLKPKSKK